MSSIIFGTYQLQTPYESVLCALKAGYRRFDTAKLYKNESEVARAIHSAIESGIVKREDVYITTKIHNKDNIKGYKKIISSFERSLSCMDMEYVDCLLLHAPIRKTMTDAWNALVQIRDNKKTIHIGVSNYDIDDLKYFHSVFSYYPPINQVELSPFYRREDLVSFCNDNNIKIEAHTPLCRGKMFGDEAFDNIDWDQLLYYTREKLSKCDAMLLWGFINKYNPIPRSDNKIEIDRNMYIYKLYLWLECHEDSISHVKSILSFECARNDFILTLKRE